MTPRRTHRDHPREYGENLSRCGFHRYLRGPSPRIRGESLLRRRLGCHGRTIPANTGRIGGLTLLRRRLGDHPREYGENAAALLQESLNPGPSPRIRGESACISPPYLGARTIPANTGRIDLEENPKISLGDHPREYGENVVDQILHFARVGPSPRIRGELQAGVESNETAGTIPANTGRINCTLAVQGVGGDHPREYGEN